MKILLRKQLNEEYVEIYKEKEFTLEELVLEYQRELPYEVLLGRVNGNDEELTYRVTSDVKIEFLDMRTNSANLAYQHSLSLVYLKAVMEVLGNVVVKIENSLNKGLYTEIKIDRDIEQKDIEKIELRMKELVGEDIPIVKKIYSKEEAIKIWGKYNYPEKSALLESVEGVTMAKFYSLNNYLNFFYGLMLPSTGYIKEFELKIYEKGVLLRFPHPTMPDKLFPYKDDKKIYKTFEENNVWKKILGISYLQGLNEEVKKGNSKEMILLSEALHDKKIVEIAKAIQDNGKRLILIAGPSSSGKTTFAKRLCIQLKVNGLETHYMGTDDYFVERKDTPICEDGGFDFENLNALDLDLFNANMADLLLGKEVDLPTFDFLEGRKNFGDRITSVRDDELIVIEGIHALNNKLSEHIDEKDKYKIYISPFTQLNVDVHNRISTTDVRMIKRIVRDYKYRGYNATQTIESWPKVRRGEDKNIFPYNDEADVFFNSSLVYELSVLKKHVEPLLEAVEEGTPEYSEAQRILKFIKFFVSIDNEDDIPNNSMLREFIGGSVFLDKKF